MKKIIGILLAGALVTSAFAADVSAKVQLEGELLNIKDGAVNALNINKPDAQHWNPLFNASINGDRAGAEFAVFTGPIENVNWNKGFQVAVNRFKLWFSPFANFKFIFGLNAFNLNQETILYSKSDSGIEDYGYSANFAMNGFSLDLGLLPGWGNNWLSAPNGGDVSVAATAVKAEYAADFGKINAILVAKDTFKNLKFGAGYSNTFGGVNMFANVLGYVNGNSFDALRVELFAKGNIDAFGWALFPIVNVKFADTTSLELDLVARADYNFNGVTAYLVIGQDDGNNYSPINGAPSQGTVFGLVNNDKFNMTVAPGVSGNIGGASWDVSLKFNISKDKTVISVPVVFSMGW